MGVPEEATYCLYGRTKGVVGVASNNRVPHGFFKHVTLTDRPRPATTNNEPTPVGDFFSKKKEHL